MNDLQEMTKWVTDFRDARDWKQFHKPKDLALSMALEAAEVMELFQWKNEQEAEAAAVRKKEQLAEELSDVMYFILLFVHDYGIDLKAAMKAKMEKNGAKYPVEKSKGSSKKYTEL